MEQAGNVFQRELDRIKVARQAWVAAGNPIPGDPMPECATCNGAKIVKSQGSLRKCPTCYVAPAIEERLKAAGIERAATFAQWRLANEMRESYDACQALLAGTRWCVFMRGGPGRGKTHLAKATVREWLLQGKSALFRKVPRLLDDMRETYAASSRGDDESQARARQKLTTMLDLMRDTDLLVLDDFGVQKDTLWASEKLYTIIDTRYETHKPLIVTSNVMPDPDNEPYDRTIDRLKPGEIVIQKGISRRVEYDV